MLSTVLRHSLSKLLTFFLIVFVVNMPLYAQSRGNQNLNIGNNNNSTSNIGMGAKKKVTATSVSDLQEVTDGQSFDLGSGATTSSHGGLGQKIKIHILGDVTSPGVYEANVSDRALDVMRFAGPNRPTTRIVQIRHVEEETRYYDAYQYFYFGNLKHNPYLKDGDVIFIPKQTGAVRIEGPVARPGIYELAGEKSLDQIVSLVGGFTNAFSRSHPIKVIRFEDGGNKLVVNVESDKSTIKKFKIQRGDIIIVPDVVNASSEFDYSVETIPGENLIYPTSVPDVFVIGAVASPGPVPYKSHLTVKDYLGFAGAGAQSNLRHVKVLRGTKTQRLKLYSKVQAGDVIVVRARKLDTVLAYLGVISTLMGFVTTTILFKELINNQ